MHAVDFFCGAGGLTRGLIDAGISVLVGIDADPAALETYEANNGVPFLTADIRKLDAEDLAIYGLGHDAPRPLLFAGCAPCQPFSWLNRAEERPGEDLLTVFLRFVEEFRPDYVLSENVPGITRSATYERFGAGLTAMGYDFAARTVDAKSYGIPQTRKRHVLLACLDRPASLPQPTHGRRRPAQIPYATVRETIGDAARFPQLEAGEASPIPNHTANVMSELNLRRIRRTPHDGGSRSSWQDDPELGLECYRNHRGHEDVYGRMAWDRPSPTLTTKFTSITNGRFGHPEQDRAITVREGAALQTFPDTYEFAGVPKAAARHIGNAVPPLLARRLGEHIMAIHRGEVVAAHPMRLADAREGPA